MTIMTILAAWDADYIIKAAGGSQDLDHPATFDATGTSITVTVLGCTQATLDAAVAAYDHTARMRAVAIAKVRAETMRRIDLVVDPATRDGLKSTQVTLAAVGLAGFTGAQTTQWNGILGQLAPVAAVRSVAQTIEAEVATMTAEQIAAYDVTTDSRWPA